MAKNDSLGVELIDALFVGYKYYRSAAKPPVCVRKRTGRQPKIRTTEYTENTEGFWITLKAKR